MHRPRPTRHAGRPRPPKARRLAAALALAAAAAQAAPTLQAQRLVEQGQPLPGSGETFAYLYPAQLAGNRLVFQGWNFSFADGGLYSVPFTGGTPTRLVGPQTPVPGGSGTFTSLNRVDCQDMATRGTQVFHAGVLSSGVYRTPAAGGSVLRLADDSTPYPDGPVNGGSLLRQACRLTHDGNALVFDTGGFQDGIYRVTAPGVLQTVASPLQPYDQGPCATFRCGGFFTPSGDAGQVAYVAGNVFGPQAILLAPREPLISTLDAVPASGGGRFVVLQWPSIAGSRVAFRSEVAGGTALARFGVYQVRTTSPGTAVRLLDANSPVPGQPGERWTAFDDHVATGRNAVLINGSSCPVNAQGQCTAGPAAGVYLACGTQVRTVLRDGQVVDGRTLRVSTDSLGGAAVQTLADGSRVLRFALLSRPGTPEPVAQVLVTLGGLPAGCL